MKKDRETTPCFYMCEFSANRLTEGFTVKVTNPTECFNDKGLREFPLFVSVDTPYYPYDNSPFFITSLNSNEVLVSKLSCFFFNCLNFRENPYFNTNKISLVISKMYNPLTRVLHWTNLYLSMKSH